MSEPVTTKAPGRRRMYLLVRMLCEGGLMIALAPALSEDLAGQLGQSPGRLLLFSTIPEELEDRDWQETDGFRWTALEAEGDHSLLDALTAQAAALWESGAEGPAVALVYP